MSVSPIEQYPEMAPPSVSISASYPGATAEVIANQVAAPIESQIQGIANPSYFSPTNPVPCPSDSQMKGISDLLYFSSTSSSSGKVAINVVLKPGSDPDINQVN